MEENPPPIFMGERYRALTLTLSEVGKGMYKEKEEYRKGFGFKERKSKQHDVIILLPSTEDVGDTLHSMNFTICSYWHELNFCSHR